MMQKLTRRFAICCFLATFVLAATTNGARATEPDESRPRIDLKEAGNSASERSQPGWDTCRRIEVAALMWTLPPAFLARLIWRESRFDPAAVSPVGAQGIAQFMPATARYRQLDDPFDLTRAIPASAHYLSDLRNQFGNLGLAAAAYNAGPGRVADWLAGISGLPAETWNFVTRITGHAPDVWNGGERPKANYELDEKLDFLTACRKLPIRPLHSAPVQASRDAEAQWQPWGAHLTAAWTQSQALSLYAGLQRKHPDILAGQKPMVLRVVNHRLGRAPRFEIRIGRSDRASAVEFCRRVKRDGGVCLPLKTEKR